MKHLDWIPVQEFAKKSSYFAKLPLIGVMVFGLWFLYLHESAQSQSAPPVPTCQIGAYLMSLHSFDLAKQSFGADFWLWSVCPNEQLQPLNSVEFINAKEIKTTLSSTVREQSNALRREQAMYWSALKVSGTFRHDWDIHNFPFDRHNLQIILEESNANTDQFVYRADRAQSSYGKDIQLQGWQISKFDISESQRHYATTFGNPKLRQTEGSNYSRLVISVMLTRDRLLSFFKLNSGIYIATALAMLSFFLNASHTSLMGARIGMLVGCMFATLINLRVAETVLGHPEYLTLVDQIHITGLAFIFGAAVVGINSCLRCEEGREQAARYRDRYCFIGFSVAFLLVNVILIGAALVAEQ